MPANSTSLRPTYEGFVRDTKEALLLFEGVLRGSLPRVTRRPHDRERSSLIKSGSIFIYEEGASGIKRWTDGVPWSPSRILGNFLIYRELEKPFPPGEKKRATKKMSKRPGEDPMQSDGLDSSFTSPIEPDTPTSPMVKNEYGSGSNSDKETERLLVGSLTDSYAFKDQGLIKKTMSVNVEGVQYHMVSYYNPEDVRNGTLHRPNQKGDLSFLKVRPELIHRQNFRAPVEDMEESMQQYAQSMRPNQPYMAPHGFVPHSTAGYMPHVSAPMHTAPGYGMQMHGYSQQYSDPHVNRSMPTSQAPSLSPQAPQHGYYAAPTSMPAHSQSMAGAYNPYAQYQDPSPHKFEAPSGYPTWPSHGGH